MQQQWRIQLFGGLCIEQGEHVVNRFRTQKTASLLAYLALHPGPQPREILVELLWTDDEPESGRHSLRTALSSLRRQFEPTSSLGLTAHGALLQADRASAGLRASCFTTDVAEFRQALLEAKRAGDLGNREEQARCWAKALELHHSPLLPGFYENWVVAEEASLREEFFRALRRLLSFLEERADWSRALEYARRGVGIDPSREEAHYDLMRLLALSGSHGEALRQYHEVERLLKRQLGAAPSQATRDLASAIESGRIQTSPALRTPQPTGTDRTQPLLQVVQDDTSKDTLHLPSTVTMLVADFDEASETSTKLSSAEATRWRKAVRRELRRYAGQEISLQSAPQNAHWQGATNPEFVVAFVGATAALSCAVAAMRLTQRATPTQPNFPLLRVALCTGETNRGRQQPVNSSSGKLLLDEYLTNRALGVLCSGHPGQILCSEETAALLRGALHDEPQHQTSQNDLHTATSTADEAERSAPGPNPPGTTELRDLGLYHLHSSTGNLTPERLFGVLVSGITQSDLPPLRAEPARGAVLPLPLNRFFGRENEIAQLRQHLQRERLVTLSGAGGSGKTRLSLQVAALLSEERVAPWHGAVFFVPLADLLDADLVADHILSASRVPRLSHLSPLENIVQALCHPPQRATLLVLDNFEHLVDDGAAIVHTLLERVPGLKCLVTSRRLLGVPGEREMPLAPLPLLPDFSAPERPEDLQNEPCVHLFLDRARSASPDFALTPRNAPAIAALCRRLECMPLALELAAARAGSLSPARMLALLETHLDDGQPSSFKQFDFLQSRERTSPARHRTLRATLDWSYNLLEPQRQHFLAALAVFRGGCTVEAAHAVCGEEDALDLLEHLRECSLLLSAQQSEGEPRFHMLEIIREYAFEQLEARGDTAQTRRRHAQHFLTLAEAEAPNFLASDAKERLLCLERVKAEHDNLRAAMGWSLKNDAVMALRLVLACDALSGDSIREAELPIERALQNTEGAPAALVGAVLDIAVAHTGRRGDFVRQSELALWRWKLANDSGEPRTIAWALFSLGSAERRAGQFSEAREHLSQSVDIFRQLQEWQCVGWALNELGNTTLDANDVAYSCTIFEECAEAFARSGDRDGVASARAQLADALYYTGDAERARELFEEVAAIERELGDNRDHYWRRHQRGKIEGSLGNYDTAHALLKDSLHSFISAGNKVGMLCSLLAFGCLTATQGRYEQAVCLLSAEAAQRAALQWPPLLQWQSACDRALDSARSALSASEYSKACAWGESLTLHEAIEVSIRD